MWQTQNKCSSQEQRIQIETKETTVKAYYLPFSLALALACKMLVLPLGVVELGAIAVLSGLTGLFYYIDHNEIKKQLLKVIEEFKVSQNTSNKKTEEVLEELRSRVDNRSKEIDEVKQILKMSKVGQIRG
jgi:hypothetical protein